MAALGSDGLVITKNNGRWSVNYKQYLKDESGIERGAKPFSILDGPYTQIGTAEIDRLFGDAKVFPFPKPSALIAHFIQYAHPEKKFIVLDFFAGSGSTLDAILRLNMADSGRRRFIAVQLPERTGRDDFATIAEITKERVRKVGRKLKSERGFSVGDVGFRVFKLDTSNIRAWDPDRENLERSLLDNVEHVKSDRSEVDVLYELLLKLGLDLCATIESRSIANKRVNCIDSGALLVCLAECITREDVEPLALGIAEWHTELAPDGDTTAIFRDSAFADDVAKTNLEAILRQHGIGDVRSL